MVMTTTRPYLIRAFYEWIVDNACTPYIVINAEIPTVLVPEEYVKEGQIVMNISIRAVQNLILGNDAIEFQARFAGKIRRIYAPISSILAIYAKENGRGMIFSEEGSEQHPPHTPDSLIPPSSPAEKDEQMSQGKGKPKGKPPHLTIVK
jgi:stringent starvation protein B